MEHILRTVVVCSSDKALYNFSLKNIRNPRDIKERTSTMVE